MNSFPVSLIITTYNKEEYIRKCLESALSQSLENVEIVVVDDGSTDNTVEIIKEYCDKNDNIKFLQNETNHGAGYTKNYAVKEAKGEYISFLDADDYIPPNYLEKLYTPLKHSGLSIAVADMIQKSEKWETAICLSDNNCYLNTMGFVLPQKNEPSIISSFPVIASVIGASPCTKLIKRELLQKYPFYEGRRCDDILCVMPILAAEQRVLYVPNNYYYYVLSGESLERTKTLQKTMDGLISVRETIKLLKKLQVSDVCSQLLASSSLLSLLAELFGYVREKNGPDAIREVCDVIVREGMSPLLEKTKNPYLNNLAQYDLAPKTRMAESLLPLVCKNNKEKLLQQLTVWQDENNTVFPLVSIVIPVYNGANYLREAIDSALAQTYPNIEVLVINDGSMDDGETEKIALSYGDRIRYFYKENGGVATALNLGIQKMHGVYFSWLSHDDMYKPEKVEKAMDIIRASRKESTVVASGYEVVDANGGFMYSVNLATIYSQKKLKNPLFVVLRGGIHGCALLIHKSHFDRVGLFDASLPSTQDYDLWFRMFQDCPFIYSERNDVLSRSHEEQNSRKMENHLRDCNRLWIWMMENTSPKKRQEISGSEQEFFEEMIVFLQTNTNYTEAIQFAKEKAALLANEKYRKLIADMRKGKCWHITAPLRKVGAIISPPHQYEESEAKQEWEAMQNSYSWRMTKPLRLLKKKSISLKKNGVHVTLKRIKHKIKGKWKHHAKAKS